MACDPELLKRVSLFALLDDDERAVLAEQVEARTFAARQRIYKLGDRADRAFILVSGAVCVSTVDSEEQDVVVAEPALGEFFGFASMLEQTAHQTNAVAVTDATCLEVDREDIAVLLQQKPDAGMDILAVMGRQLHSAQTLVRMRAGRHPNEVIEEKATLGNRIADTVAGFGGSWTFILSFLCILGIYALVNVRLRGAAWDPYPFILLNLFLSMLAALQAPVIMMSQNRQDTKDRLRGELDYDVNRRAAADILGMAGKLNALMDKVDDIDGRLRAPTATGGPTRAARP